MEPGLRGDHFVFTDLETLSRFKHPSLFEVALLAATFGACNIIKMYPGMKSSKSDAINAVDGAGKAMLVGAKLSSARSLGAQVRRLVEADGVSPDQAHGLVQSQKSWSHASAHPFCFGRIPRPPWLF